MALQLAAGLAFEDLYRREGLERIDRLFLDRLATHDAGLAGRLSAARAAVASDAPPSAKDEAALLIDLAPRVDAFVAELFDIGEALADSRSRHLELDPLYQVKWKFVKRQALVKVSADQLAGFDADAAFAQLTEWLGQPFEELAFARAVLVWQEAGDSARLELAMRYSAWAVQTHEGQERHSQGVLVHPVME